MKSLDLKSEARHMLSRWLPSQLALGSDNPFNTQSVNRANTPNPLQVSQVLKNSTSDHLGILEDALAYGFSTGCISTEDLANLAKKILLERRKISRSQNSLAEALADTNGQVEAKYLIHTEACDRSISWLRRRIRNQPNDSLAWLDLGYLNALRGNLFDAEKNVLTALHLGQFNPFIIRSGSRFLVHNGELENALKVTRRALEFESNPSLFATEIALSDLAERPSRWLATAKKSIFSEHKILTPSMAEIAAAVATNEAKEGSRHKLRKILSREWGALHENVHSQLLWVTNFADLNIPSNIQVVGNRAETDFREAFAQRSYSKAVEAASSWLEYQPFSTAPATYGSYVAATHLQDYNAGFKLCESALYSNPYDFCLLNNAAFCAAKSEDLGNAESYLRLASHAVSDGDATEKAVLSATRGLVAFRLGEFSCGDSLYRDAVEYFDRNELPRESWLAIAIWAEERARIGDPKVLYQIEELNKLIETDKMSDISDSFRKLKNFLRQGIGDLAMTEALQTSRPPSLPPSPPLQD